LDVFIRAYLKDQALWDDMYGNISLFH
jgi:sensor domain CHASE-containing protein